MKSIVLGFLFFPIVGYTQLITHFAYPETLINQSFLGENYIISNIEYTGDSLAKGQFNGEFTNLGLLQGVVLTTGTVLNTNIGGLLGGPQGPHGPNSTNSSGVDNGAEGYQPLENLAGEQTMNASVLEFDFIPLVDSINLSYVFGSEEYPEFVNAGYNDVFAIFISGPGIIDSVNIAVLPSGLPVTIDNVNSNLNSEYYIDNMSDSQTPSDIDDTYIQYDGFTSILSASMGSLIIGETYHLIIAISDVGDGSYDSGLFIEKCPNCAYEIGTDESASGEGGGSGAGSNSANIISNDAGSNLSVYPNPTSGDLNVDFYGTGILYLYDLLGALIVEKEIVSGNSILDLSDIQNGLYVLIIKDGDNVFKTKVVVK